MARCLNVDDLLQGLRAEGEAESSGTFTLDSTKALEKLRSFQLPNPFYYCLKWLQAAVVGQASEFHWNSSGRDLSVVMPGLELSLDRLNRMPLLLLDSSACAAERQLSASLNGVIKTKADEVSISTWNGSDGLRATWTPGDFRQDRWRPAEAGPSALTVVELRRSAGDSWDDFWYAANNFHVGSRRGSRHARDREQQILHARGGYARVKLSIQGFAPEYDLKYAEPPTLLTMFTRFLGAPVEYPQYPFDQEHWFSSETHVGFRRLARAKSRNGVVPPDQAPCRIYAARPLRKHPQARIYPVKDGVLLDTIEVLRADLDGWVFVCCASSLTTDLTGFRIVQDEAWRALLWELERIVT